MPLAVVTGSNRGIGLACCQQLSANGYDVIALCRKANPELESLGVMVEEGVDITDEKRLHDIAEKYRDRTVDLLINNAGILERESLENLNWDSIRRQFEVNTLGPLKVTQAFLPLMKRGGKIGMITSRMGSIDDNTSGGRYGYRISKAGLNILSKSLSIDLKESGIAVAVIHPGFVKTAIIDFRGDVPVETAAERILERLDELNLENSGTFWHASGEVLPW